MSKRTSKVITFTSKEQHLLEWAEKQDKPFASFMKDLIREDMKIKQYSKEELKNIVKEIIVEFNISSVPSEVKKIDSLGSKGKNAYKNLLRK